MTRFTPYSYCMSDCFKLIIFVIYLTPAKAGTPVYSMDNNNLNENEYHDVATFQHFNEPFDQRVFGKVNIDVLEVTPSSIHVKWRLSNMTHSDSFVEASFLCETLKGRIVSDKLHSNTDSFRFEFLNSNTEYVICVHLLEKSKSTNTSILHYNCQPFSTIQVIRPDSLLGVALTLGYFLMTVVLGYLAWYRRSRQIKNNEEKEKFKIEENEGDKEDDYYQFVKAADSGGFSNYTADDVGRSAAGGLNGGSIYKPKSNRGDCSGACVPFSAKEEEELVEYDASKREISF